MHATIDSAGRVVIPKAIREMVGLVDQRDVEISARDGRIQIEVPPTSMRLEKRGKGLVAVPEKELPKLKATDVRDVLESVRR